MKTRSELIRGAILCAMAASSLSSLTAAPPDRMASPINETSKITDRALASTFESAIRRVETGGNKNRGDTFHSFTPTTD